MGELDDLAAAARERQRVPVRRRQTAAPAVIVQQPHYHAAPRGRSPFVAAYLGTFGVIAALLTVTVVLAAIGIAMRAPQPPDSPPVTVVEPQRRSGTPATRVPTPARRPPSGWYIESR